MGDPWSKETGDKVMDRIEQGLSIEQVCDKYNALKAENERLTAERDQFYMDYRVKCDEETKTLHAENERLREVIKCKDDALAAAMQALAATEQDLRQPSPLKDVDTFTSDSTATPESVK